MSETRPREGASLETLFDWLTENAPPNLLIAGEYRMADLLADLDRMLDRMWSDSIDAMGEDA